MDGLFRAIAQLLPGYQPWLGERAGAQGVGQVPVLGNVTQAIAALLPGYQPWLGEMPSGYAGVPGLFTGTEIAYSWNTGTAIFYRLRDGRIAVQKKNGVWKVYRPKKPLVLYANPRVGTLIKADQKINRLVRGLDVTIRRASRRRITRKARRVR